MIQTIQSVIFLGYILIMFLKNGTQKSVSAIYYTHKENYRWIFSLVFFTVGALNFFHGNIWFALGGCALAFVGAAAQYKEDITKTVHNIGAWGSIVFSLIGVVLLGNYVQAVITVLAIGFVHFTVKQNRTTWVEITAFILLILGTW